jgi:putative ABC transport system ATP-binding protein
VTIATPRFWTVPPSGVPFRTPCRVLFLAAKRCWTPRSFLNSQFRNKHSVRMEERHVSAVLSARGLVKRYPLPAGEVTAVAGIDLEVTAGEFVAVVGRSGSGKTTLLNLLAGIDTPSAGEIWVAGQAVHELRGSRLAAWRGRAIGLVFQFFQLLPTLTVAENVMLPMDLCRTVPARQRRPRALDLLARVGIADQADKLPAALSGGQQQRAAIARALANEAPVLLADEPTGNLDSATSDAVLDLFARLARDGRTVLMVTHERDVSGYATRVVELADGRVSADAPAVAR